MTDADPPTGGQHDKIKKLSNCYLGFAIPN